MRLRKFLAPLFGLTTALAALPAVGCYGTATVHTSGYYVEDIPPPREEVVVYRPGYLWVHGRWVSNGDRWAWRGGYYERERPNYIYAQGYWERRGRNHVWVDGGWRANGRVVLRDRRGRTR